MLPNELKTFVQVIDEFLINPLDPETGSSISSLVQKKKAPRPPKAQQDKDADGSGNNSSESDAVFSDPETAALMRGVKGLKDKTKKKKGGGKTRARRGDANASGDRLPVEGGAGASQRQRRRMEEAKMYRTAEFIEDSDDDEDADRAFFEREERLRRDMEVRAGKSHNLIDGGKKKKKQAKMDAEERHESEGPIAGSKSKKSSISQAKRERRRQTSEREGSDDQSSEVDADSSSGDDSASDSGDVSAVRKAQRTPLSSVVDTSQPSKLPHVDQSQSATHASSSPLASVGSLKRSRLNAESDDSDGAVDRTQDSGQENRAVPYTRARAATVDATRPLKKKRTYGRFVVESDAEDDDD